MSNDSKPDLTQVAFRKVIEGLRPFMKAMGDEYTRESVLNALGVPPGAPIEAPPPMVLSSLDGYVGQADPDLIAFQSTVEDLLSVVQSFNSWVQNGINRDNAPDGEQLFSMIMTAFTTSYVRNRLPLAWSILKLLGFLEEKVFGQALSMWDLSRVPEFWNDAGTYFAQRYNHDEDDRVFQALSDGIFVIPTVVFLTKSQRELARRGIDIGVLYGWEIMDPDNISDEDRVSNRAFTLRIRTPQSANEASDLFVNFILIPGNHGGNGLFLTFSGDGFQYTAKESNGKEGWKYNIDLPIPNFSLWMTGSGVEVADPNQQAAVFKFKATPPTGLQPWKLLSKGTRIEMSPNGFELELGASKSGAKLAIKTAIIISTGDADNFIGKMVGAGEFKTELDITFVFSAKGIGFEGALGLQIVIPVSKAINLGAASVTLQQVTLGINIGSEGFKLEAGMAISLKLGPLTLVVEQLGFKLFLEGFKSDGVSLGFKEPKGIGVSIGTSSVGGGGYLFWDLEQEQYAGALLLAIEGLATLKAVGILTTRLPDDPDGFSLLVIISAEFTPIQLGFGFMLTGIGGLLGINRTVIPEAMRAGVKNRTLDAIMFPKDPVGNAPIIVSQLNNVFPPSDQRYTFGLMVQIRWATLLQMDLGLIVEIPAPIRVIILGKMSLFAPHELIPLVEMHLDVVGILDFGACEISIDASLYDSHVLLLTLTGDMALRASWGDNADFGVSVGGFHPKYVPPANFPRLERAAITLSTGNNPRIRCECYYALTSNSLQMGARAELYAGAGGFSVLGFIGWDLLIQFDPFGFRADFSAGLALQAAGVTLMSVTVEGTLAGFKPLWVSGSASFTLLFFTVSFGFKFTLVEGSGPPSALPVDVLAMLVAALTEGSNWSAHLPPQFAPLFALREVFSETDVVVHPLAQLAVRQTVVPLGLTIEKFGESEPAGESFFQVNSVKIGNANVTTTPLTAAFAPGQFFDLSDAERLTRPSFEQMQAGVRFGTLEGQHGQAVEKTLTYETKVVQPETEFVVIILGPYQINQETLDIFTLSGAVARSDARKTGRTKYAAPKIGVTYHETEYAVASRIDRTKTGDQPGLRSYSMVKQALREQQGGAPDSHLQIVNLEEALSA